jgi:DUF4097 and DUF4098 domain-containing protein YvlB
VTVYGRMRSAFFLAATLLSSAAGLGCVVSVDSQAQIVREEKRFTVSATPDVHVSTFDGSIEIQSWDSPDVLVEIEKRGATHEAVDALEVKTAQDGNRVELEVKQPRSERFSTLGFHRSATARLLISVPRRADIQARSGDGSIRIDRVNGRIELRTGDGSITASRLSGDLVMNTGDGSVTVNGADGRLVVDTGDGGVNVTGRLTAVKLHTGDGSIVYRAEPESRMTEDWNITTGDGAVTLYLPRNFSADLDAHTGDGNVRNDLEIVSPAGEVSRRTLRGRLGSGGKLLRVRTGDGSIRLHGS